MLSVVMWQLFLTERHCRYSDVIRTPVFISFIQVAIDEVSEKSIRVLGIEFHIGEATIRPVVHEYLSNKLYMMRRGKFVPREPGRTELPESSVS